MSDEHTNANKYLKGRFINIGNIIIDTTNNWQFMVEMEQTNKDSVFADTISVLTFLNEFAEENEQLKQQNDFLTNQLAELSAYMMALGWDIELEFKDGRVIKLNKELNGDVE